MAQLVPRCSPGSRCLVIVFLLLTVVGCSSATSTQRLPQLAPKQTPTSLELITEGTIQRITTSDDAVETISSLIAGQNGAPKASGLTPESASSPVEMSPANAELPAPVLDVNRDFLRAVELGSPDRSLVQPSFQLSTGNTAKLRVEEGQLRMTLSDATAIALSSKPVIRRDADFRSRSVQAALADFDSQWNSSLL